MNLELVRSCLCRFSHSSGLRFWFAREHVAIQKEEEKQDKVRRIPFFLVFKTNKQQKIEISHMASAAYVVDMYLEHGMLMITTKVPASI